MTMQIGSLLKTIPCWFWIGDYAGTTNYFTSSETFGTPPTKAFLYENPPYTTKGVITHIIYMLKPTNVQTYTLRLFRNNDWAGVDTLQATTAFLFQSAAGKAGSTLYTEPTTSAGATAASLNIPFTLWSTQQLFYQLEWSGAPGATSGVIYVKGICYDNMNST
jgi:hypothetical protein